MALIYTCPDCDADLDDDGIFGLWCEHCQHHHPHALFDGDPDGERDRMMDDRDGLDV